MLDCTRPRLIVNDRNEFSCRAGLLTDIRSSSWENHEISRLGRVRFAPMSEPVIQGAPVGFFEWLNRIVGVPVHCAV